MKHILLISILLLFTGCNFKTGKEKIFDVHLHGEQDPENQVRNLITSNVRAMAISTSWSLQQTYRGNEALEVLHGIFVPCPNGKVPYSLQQCFEDGKEWPDVIWVEQQIKKREIDFIGEVLTQYRGISSSDKLMFPYFALAEKYNLPVGIHTGSAGPDHGCPGFSEAAGNPLLLKEALTKFPKLKVWLMHGGGPYTKECIEMMRTYPGLYADISVLNNPDIVPAGDFYRIMKDFIDAGLEDRILFGSDNADITTCIASIKRVDFLSEGQMEKIFYLNAKRFFSRSQ